MADTTREELEPPEAAVPRLPAAFFSLPCESLARALLGRLLVRRFADGSRAGGRIVETEAYLGGEDQASHSRGGRRTRRTQAMYMKPGTLYVYQIYGLYFCLNVSSRGEGAAVLIRSLEPLLGLEAMRQRRGLGRKASAALKDRELCNGPGKLCQALGLTKAFDRRDLATDSEVWLEAGRPDTCQEEIVLASRVGVGGAGEWADKPLRFYLQGNRCVSVVVAQRSDKAKRRKVTDLTD